ncbi:vacuolar protein sorting-associated protein 35 [Monosporozyma unispora]
MVYADTFDHARSNIKQNSILMKRQLDKFQLMEALKFTSNMLQELRNPHWSPKQYYELYILIFDSLTILSEYLIENHPKRHHLADLYELVQYAGNVIPRLYLMITVGTCYLHFETGTTRQEILKDMIEMARGVQNPIRGLFIRYFISQRTKEFLIEDETLTKKQNNNEEDVNVISTNERDLETIKFNCQFILNNFIEMNKLWVRLQYQGPLKERDQRTKERKELQILIGSQLVRLSQIIEDDEDVSEIGQNDNKYFQIYSQEILPALLEQIIQCKDTICQEYLFDIICQVFPDHYHFKTLDQLLNTTIYLNPKVHINKLIITLIHRLTDYVNRQGLTTKDKDNNDDNGGNDIFETFWKYINDIKKERHDFPLDQFILLIQDIIHLSLSWYNQRFDHVESLFQFLFETFKEQKLNSTEMEYLDPLLLQLLTFAHENDGNDIETNKTIEHYANFYYQVIIKCPSFTKVILALNTRKAIQIKIITTIVNKFIIHELFTEEKEYWILNSKVELEKLLEFLQPLINYQNPNGGNGQESVAKMCHIIYNNMVRNKKITSFKTIENQLEVVLSLKNRLNNNNGNPNTIITYPTIITIFWKLIRTANYLKSKLTKRQDYYHNLIKQIFKYVSRCNSDLFDFVNLNNVDNEASDVVDMDTNIKMTDFIFKLNLTNASLADQLGYNEIAYDFFSQAFTVFEESLSDSKTQFQALNYMTQCLQKTRSLYGENEEENKDNYYDSLIVRCTLHGSKLLKKQDQCRSVYLCSHLWWATEINSIGEDEEVEDGDSTQHFYRNGRRLLECLQRSLRTADSIMDNVQSCELMVELLNRCLYYFARGEEYETRVTANYINGLIELIKTNLKSLSLEEINDLTITEPNEQKEILSNEYVTGLDGTYWKLPSKESSPAIISIAQLVKSKLSIRDMISIPTDHFNRTCDYILTQRSLDARFQNIVV